MDDTLTLDLAAIEAELRFQSPDLLLGLDRAADARAETTSHVTRGTAPTAAGRLAPETQRRLRTLVLLEELFADYGEPELLDYGFLVFGVCQMVEAEVGRRMQRVSLPMHGHLIDCVADAPGPHRVLTEWASGRVPLSLGTVQILYMAWRRYLSLPNPPAHQMPFPAHFSERLHAQKFERAVGQLRNGFRNPVAHGATCSLDQHEACLSLCLGATSIAGWIEFDVDLGADALLQAHLSWGNCP